MTVSGAAGGDGLVRTPQCTPGGIDDGSLAEHFQDEELHRFPPASALPEGAWRFSANLGIAAMDISLFVVFSMYCLSPSIRSCPVAAESRQKKLRKCIIYRRDAVEFSPREAKCPRHNVCYRCKY